ncbi:hypothetical protein FS842_011351, partial [Serendipita sp. 407]
RLVAQLLNKLGPGPPTPRITSYALFACAHQLLRRFIDIVRAKTTERRGDKEEGGLTTQATMKFRHGQERRKSR